VLDRQILELVFKVCNRQKQPLCDTGSLEIGIKREDPQLNR
jgi:hypothetical protein